MNDKALASSLSICKRYIFFYDSGGVTHDYTISGYAFEDNRTDPNFYMITDLDIANDTGMSPNIDMVTNSGAGAVGAISQLLIADGGRMPNMDMVA